jgi:hypothetical protein
MYVHMYCFLPPAPVRLEGGVAANCPVRPMPVATGPYADTFGPGTPAVYPQQRIPHELYRRQGKPL